MNFISMLSFVVALLLPWTTVSRDPIVEDFQDIYNLIYNEIVDDDSLGREILRLSFHDAMGTLDGYINEENTDHNGLGDATNLLNAIWSAAELEFFVLSEDDEFLANTFDKADFFAWSYVAAFYFFVDEDEIPWVPLKFGYSAYLGGIDESPSEDIPPGAENGSGNHTAVLEYFDEIFGFSETEVATIMGAHTIGGAQRQNSGYINDWTRTENSFNNQYYETLVDPPQDNNGWEQIAITSDLDDGTEVTKFQWVWGCGGGDGGGGGNQGGNRRRGRRGRRGRGGLRGAARRFRRGIGGRALQRGGTGGRGGNNNGCRDLMLNVDMNLFFELTPYMDEESGQVTLPDPLPDGVPDFCGTDGRLWADCFPQRTDTPTHDAVNEFRSENSQVFIDDFAIVFGKMLSRVEDGIELTVLDEPATWPPEGFETRNNRRSLETV